METRLKKMIEECLIKASYLILLDEDEYHFTPKELQAIIDEACKEQRSLKYDSKGIIGDVHNSFDDLKHKHYDWSSYYNGWLNGRAEMLNEMKHMPQPKTGI